MDTLDKKIEKLQQKGLSIRGIGRELGLTHVAVLKRLKRDKASGKQAKTRHSGPDSLLGNLNGDLLDQPGNQLCKPSDCQSPTQLYQKDLCKNWESCPVCQLPLDSYLQLRDLYRLGAPSSVLCSYFNLTAKALADHSFRLNWHKKKAQIENPERKRVIRQMIEDETWKVVMGSSSEGYAKDKLSGLKLLSELEGLGESEKSQGVSPGVVVNMRFSLNSGYNEDQGAALVDLDEEYEEDPQ